MTCDVITQLIDKGYTLPFILLALAGLVALELIRRAAIAFINDVTQRRMVRLEIARKRAEFDLDRTAQVDRVERLSIVERFQKAQDRIKQLEESKVSTVEHAALKAELDELKKSFVVKAVHEQLQTDYTTMQTTLNARIVEGDGLIKGLQEKIKEQDGALEFFEPLAQRTERAESAYDLMQQQNHDQAELIAQLRDDCGESARAG